MHPSVLQWFQDSLTVDDVAGKSVLEVGSADVNGSVRPHMESLGPAFYHGVDAGPGPRVDEVVNCENLVRAVGSDWDIVISTEMLEHVRSWRICMLELAQAVKPGGLLLLTTRSPGFPYHPYPEDHWRYTPALMAEIFDALNLSARVIADTDRHSPGVFARAVKPSANWEPNVAALSALEAEGVTM